MSGDLQSIFEQSVKASAWRTRDKTLSYGELEERVRRHATLLKSHGAKAGDYWAVRGWPALDTFALFLASAWQGIILFLLPDRLPPAMHAIMCAQIPLKACLEPSMLSAYQMEPGPIHCDANAPALGVFTSGTTGLPKAIIHSWSSLSSSARASNQFYQMKPRDSWLLGLDIAHIGGLQIALRCFLGTGITWNLAEPNALAAVLQQENPDFISLVPTQLYRLLEDKRACAQLRSSKAIILGGAATTMELWDRAHAKGLPISVSYGSTETAAQCSALPPLVRPSQIGDVGYLLQNWSYQQIGETLRLRGPATCYGYYQQQKFYRSCDNEGWMTLPDRVFCQNRRLTLIGRVDGIFQVAGENIAPAAIVQPLETLQGDADFLALPAQDDEYGTVPILVIRSTEKPAVDSIVGLLKQHLTGVQRPRRIYWHQSDAVGKASRGYYAKALEADELPLIWRDDFGRI